MSAPLPVAAEQLEVTKENTTENVHSHTHPDDKLANEKGSKHTDKKTTTEYEPTSAYWRVFTLSDRYDIALLLASLVAASGSGAALALVNVIIGNFVTIVNDFTSQKTSPEDFRNQSGTYALRFIYLFLARFALTYVYTVSLTLSSTRISRKLRSRFLEATLSQDIAYFESGVHGSVSASVVTNGNLVSQGIGEKLGTTIQAVASFITAFIVAIVTQWKLALITLTIAPAIILVTVVCFALDASIENKVLKFNSIANALADDIISSVKNVAAFWAGPKLLRKYDTLLQAAHKTGLTKCPVYGVLFSAEFFMVYAGFSLCFWQGAHRYASGEIDSPGTIVTVLFSVVIATQSMTMVAPNLITFTNAASAAATLFKVIDRIPEINSNSDEGLTPGSIEGDIQLNHVSFSYPSRAEVQVLHDFTLRLPKGKNVALVGPSGSGKSTIVGLIERWYNPSAGHITLDGQRIDTLNIRWLRTNIRLVQQEPVLFSGTVFDNVCYGLIGTEHEHSPYEQKSKIVREACELAYAHDFIQELPEGYNTDVGERAGQLSGGQKQRLAIARSIASNPKVLILDESTSSLDANSERIVQKALDRASANRTTLTIAHKLATIQHADQIVVMEKGRIVEQGSYQELLAFDGAFARVVRVQHLAASDEEHTEKPVEDLTDTSLRLVPTEPTEKLEHSSQQDLNYDIYKHDGFVRVLLRLLRDQDSLYWTFLIIVITCCAGGATYPAQALLFAQVMNVFQLSGQEMLDRADFFALMFFILALAVFFIYFVLGWTTNIIAQQATHFYRRETLAVLLKQDIRFFDRSENNVGAVISRLSSQPTQIMELLGFNLALILIIAVNLLSSCILAIAYGWRLGLVLTVANIPLVSGGYIRMRLEFQLANDAAVRFAESAALAGESVGAIRTVASLTLERNIMARFEDKMSGIVRNAIPRTLVSGALMAWTQSNEFLVLALGFWYGCQLVSRGDYSLQTLYVVFIATFFSGQAAAAFFQYTTSISKAVSAANYIFWLRKRTPLIAETEVNKDNGPDDGPQDMALAAVRFAYPLRPDTTVLRGITLQIRPGNFIAFVGGSGSGKSTLISLLERFYDPSSGTVLLNGKAVSTLNPRLYRSQMAIVQQEPTLYQGSIRENVVLGIETHEDVEVADDQIIDACKQANIYDFVQSLPEGLSTLCGSRGLSLSGGQRQRVSIARALIRQPKVLLLDEATSSLDSESEKIVQEALARAANADGRITIAVAHRLSTIKEADTIFVVSEGRIAEVGSYDQLYSRRGLFYSMCLAQALDKAV